MVMNKLIDIEVSISRNFNKATLKLNQEPISAEYSEEELRGHVRHLATFLREEAGLILDRIEEQERGKRK